MRSRSPPECSSSLDPASVRDLSLQLSFTAVLALVHPRAAPALARADPPP
jgi:hypothetical protein